MQVAVRGSGPFLFRITFDPKVVKPGKGYWLRAWIPGPKAGSIAWVADVPLDEEMPAAIEFMGQRP